MYCSFVFDWLFSPIIKWIHNLKKYKSNYKLIVFTTTNQTVTLLSMYDSAVTSKSYKIYVSLQITGAGIAFMCAVYMYIHLYLNIKYHITAHYLPKQRTHRISVLLTNQHIRRSKEVASFVLCLRTVWLRAYYFHFDCKIDFYLKMFRRNL